MNEDRTPSSEADFTVVSAAGKRPALAEALPPADSAFARDCYRWFVDAMNDGLLIIGKNSAIVYVNAQFARMLGYRKADLLGYQVTDFMDEAARDFMVDVVRRPIPVPPMQRNAGIVERYKLTWLRLDDRRVPTVVSVRVIFDRTGRYCGSLCVVTDLPILKGADAGPGRLPRLA
jgi:PAS domain S-box-containing protein